MKPGLFRTIFGIVMICIYIGMGILFFINFFNFDPSWTWVRYVIGILLCAYGVWRAYRQYAGIDYNPSDE
ncbi:MAG: hypothetical protein HUK14_07050 [Muribaculaceae bacterium]|nr:hypothetical protein [Muribaculaceae bacterium]